MEIDTIKISELAEGSQINNDSILVYNLNGQTKKITFQNLKNAVISALALEVSQLDEDLSAEAIARAEADTALAGDISTEAAARTAADTALADDISTEAAARTAADTALAGDISTEAAARAAADTAINNTINTLVNYNSGEITVTTSPTTLEKVGEVTIPACKSYILYVCGVYQSSACKEIAINTHNSINDVVAYNKDQYKGSRAMVIGAGSSDQTTLDIWGSWTSDSANFVKYRLIYFK